MLHSSVSPFWARLFLPVISLAARVLYPASAAGAEREGIPAAYDLPVELWATILQLATETGARPDRRWEPAVAPSQLIVDDLAHLIQVSTVCKKYAEAASLVASLQLGLEAAGEHYTVDRLDSALLLQWAGSMHSVHLYDDTLALPGAAQFLSAASKAATIEITCTTSAAADLAAELLPLCPAMTELHVHGHFVPISIPASVSTLSVEFYDPEPSHAAEVDGLEIIQPAWDPACANRLLQSAEGMPNLQHLTLDFDTVQAVQLTHAKQLPRLQTLAIAVLVGYEDVALDWVQHQPCDSLKLNIKCAVPADHRRIVRQLRKMSLSLHLELDGHLSRQLQALWSQLTVDSLLVTVWDVHCSSATHPFDTPSRALQALPSCCGKVMVDCSRCSPAGHFYITWAALTQQAADLELHVGPEVELHVLGFDESTHGYLQEPWRLSVRRAKRVHGLPPALIDEHSCGCLYMQNAAADRADQQ